MTDHTPERPDQLCAGSESVDVVSEALYRVCPGCQGTGRGSRNIGTWCEKCRQYEHGYVEKCGVCQGDCVVRVAERRLTLEQVLSYLHSDDLRDLGPEALVRRAFTEAKA